MHETGLGVDIGNRRAYSVSAVRKALQVPTLCIVPRFSEC